MTLKQQIRRHIDECITNRTIKDRILKQCNVNMRTNEEIIRFLLDEIQLLYMSKVELSYHLNPVKGKFDDEPHKNISADSDW